MKSEYPNPFAKKWAGWNTPPNADIEELCAAAYAQFLASAYWAEVRRLKLAEQPWCEDCGADEELQIHHRTYRHHGFEHKHLADLQVLCKQCHQGRHGRTKKLWNPFTWGGWND